MGRKPPQIRTRFTGGDDVPDLELPFPQAWLDFGEAEFHALAVHLQFLRFAIRKLGQGNACGCSILISPCIFECPAAISSLLRRTAFAGTFTWHDWLPYWAASRACPKEQPSGANALGSVVPKAQAAHRIAANAAASGFKLVERSVSPVSSQRRPSRAAHRRSILVSCDRRGTKRSKSRRTREAAD